MKIQVQNLGPLQKAEFDLKPLTVLVGPNNSGKTWLAYLLAGIFGPYGLNEYVQEYVERDLADYPPLDKAIEKVKQKGIATIDMHAFAEAYADTYFTNVAKLAQSWVGDFMATNPAHFSNLQASVQLAGFKETLLQHIYQFICFRDIARGSLVIRKRHNSRKLQIYTTTGDDHTTDELPTDDSSLDELLSEEDIRENIVENTMLIFHRSLYSQLYTFPTERATFITLSSSQRRRLIEDVESRGDYREIIERFGGRELFALTKLFPRSDSSNQSMSEPICRYLSTMTSIYELDENERSRREKEASNDTRIKCYIQLAELLESEILEGELYLAPPEIDPARELEFRPSEDIKLGISVASSMVKELAPLVLYLRYLARPGDLLVIDEPELSLHPAAQVKIIEFLALLVDAGLHVLVTTHSTYVVDQLSNLMEASTYTNKQDFTEKFLLERVESFISPEKVAVYEVGNGELKNILEPDGSIHWQTFSEITNLVQRIHIEMIYEGEKEDEA